MSIKPYSPSDRARWDEFVASAAGANAYHQSGWATVIEESFGHRTHNLLSEDGQGRVDGVLPLARLRSRLFGDFLVSLPYVNYGGPCALLPDTASALVDGAIRLARDLGAEHLELRLVQPDGFGLPVKAAKVSMRLELPETADFLWKAFPAKLRNQINRPMKDGLVARVGGSEELDAFYDVFCVNMRDLGTPVYAKSFFAAVLRAFPDRARICTVYHQQRPVAGALLIGFRGTLEIPWASSLRSLSRLAPNMLLYWTALKYACDTGYRVFDFGRSSPNAGTYRFKEQWGARPLPLYWHYWVRDGERLPELNPTNPKYRWAIDTWKRLPVGLTRLIGPAIVRNIP